MENIIMPELITPEFAEVIAENPEVLKIIVDHKPGEEVIAGKNCSMDCSGNPTSVKLVFCNVTIGVDDSCDQWDKDSGVRETENKVGGCHIKINGRNQKEGFKEQGSLLKEYHNLMIEVAKLEVKKDQMEKILRLIPKEICNRKLVARCKREILEAAEQLKVKRKELEYATWLSEYCE